jgi:hypothetical protein
MTEQVITPSTTDKVFPGTPGVTTEPVQQAIETIQADPFLGLVGDGKKFATPTDLAKGKQEADTFIEQLQKENQGMRDTIAKQQGIEEVVKQLNQAQTNTDVVTKPNTVDEGAIGEIVARELAAINNQSTKDTNLKTSIEALESKFGDKSGEIVTQQAAKLGMSVEQLKETASTSPTAFKTLMGLDVATKPTSNNVTLNNSSLNAASVELGGGQIVPESAEYFRNLRLSDPTTYWSSSVQQRLMKAAGAAATSGNRFTTY